MKQRISSIFIGIIFITGLLVMLYPSISNWYNNKMNSYIVSNYTQVVEAINDEDFTQILEDAIIYNDDLHSSPTLFVAGEAQDQEYIDTLDIYNGMMGYIVIAELNIKLAIYHGTDEPVLQSGIGHLEGSSLPTGEEGNHTVLTGHTGLPTAELFTNLSEMEVGDTFELYILNEVYVYEVFNIEVIEPYDVDDLVPVEGKDIVSLITCTPYGVNSHRLLVQGEQIEVVEITEYEAADITSSNSKKLSEYELLEGILIIMALLIILVFIFIIIVTVDHRRIKKYIKRQKKLQQKNS